MIDLSSALSGEARQAFHIGGRWVSPSGTRRARVVSPSTEEELLRVPLADTRDVERAVDAARTAFDQGPWPRMSAPERAAHLRRLADEVRRRLPLLARLWTAQVGAPVAFAEGFVQAGESRFDYFAKLAGSYAFHDRRPTSRGHARVTREPVGVAALFAPWNATFNIFAHKIPAALAAGCTVVVKSPPESPLDALVIAECAAVAGLPPGVVNVITADREESQALVASPGVDKISFTGSVTTGRAVARAALERFARVTLEMGGKSAAILLDDVDLHDALDTLTPLTMPFAGQVCFAQTRILAPRSRIDEVVTAYADRVRLLRVGDPWNRTTQVGPVLNGRQLRRVLGYIETGRREGARVVTGGGRSPGHEHGHYVLPTVFAGVEPAMTIAREEIFGPVVTVQAYEDVDEAVAIANATDFGLSGSVHGADPERAYRVARRVTTGQLGVNGFELAPSVPFGGRKSSGVGREGGPEGLEAYLETKAVFMPGP